MSELFRQFNPFKSKHKREPEPPPPLKSEHKREPDPPPWAITPDWYRSSLRVSERVRHRGAWIEMLDHRSGYGWCRCRLSEVASVENTPGYEVVVRSRQNQIFCIADCDDLMAFVCGILDDEPDGEPSARGEAG